MLIIAMALGAAPLQSDAQVDARLTKGYRECMDASGGVTSDMLNCTGDEHRFQDGRLNQAYKMVMARLNQRQKMTLRTAQRTWIDQRHRKCDAAAGKEGTIAQVIYSSCFLTETVRRTIWLENYKA